MAVIDTIPSMQGILLSGGLGKRLWPITLGTSKQLVPLYDKPLVYYPLSTMILGGITKVVLVSSPEHIKNYEQLLGDGSDFGIEISYAEQAKPNGIPDAFNVAESLLNEREPCALMLGDNFIYGIGVGQQIFNMSNVTNALCFGYHVSDASEFGVLVRNSQGELLNIIEKPENKNYREAIPGIYKFPGDVFAKVKTLLPSKRGELEITHLLESYLREGRLESKTLNRGVAWLDTGTVGNLHRASNFVESIQAQQGLLVGSPHESAWRRNLLTLEQVDTVAMKHLDSAYGRLLKTTIEI